MQVFLHRDHSGAKAGACCDVNRRPMANQPQPLIPLKASLSRSPYLAKVHSIDAIIIAPVRSPKLANRRLAREWNTVSAMLQIYCRDQHGGGLCQECLELANYVSLRLHRCHFGEEKPTCARCPVHCYQRERREQIKAMMRHAGPKMLWEHPWLSLWHFIDGWSRRAT